MFIRRLKCSLGGVKRCIRLLLISRPVEPALHSGLMWWPFLYTELSSSSASVAGLCSLIITCSLKMEVMTLLVSLFELSKLSSFKFFVRLFYKINLIWDEFMFQWVILLTVFLSTRFLHMFRNFSFLTKYGLLMSVSLSLFHPPLLMFLVQWFYPLFYLALAS